MDLAETIKALEGPDIKDLVRRLDSGPAKITRKFVRQQFGYMEEAMLHFGGSRLLLGSIVFAGSYYDFRKKPEFDITPGDRLLVVSETDYVINPLSGLQSRRFEHVVLAAHTHYDTIFVDTKIIDGMRRHRSVTSSVRLIPDYLLGLLRAEGYEQVLSGDVLVFKKVEATNDTRIHGGADCQPLAADGSPQEEGSSGEY